MLPVMLIVALLLPTGCGKETARTEEPIAHNEAFDIWPDSIDLHDGVVLRVMSDTVMQVRVSGNVLDTIIAGKEAAGRMTFSSDYPLLDFLYRLEASYPAPGRYGPQTPYEIYLNPLQNDSAKIMMEGRLRNGLVVPYENRHTGWPTVNSNAEWLLAASELWLATGDPQWEKTVRQTARNIIASDRRISYNPSTGLFTGIPRYMASAAGMFPNWMTQADIFQQSTLGVNAAYAGGMANLGLSSSDSLTGSLKSLMWIPNMGYFSATAYGTPLCPLPLQSTDNLAQAVAILSGILPDAMADAIVKKTPSGFFGVSHYQPALPPASGETREEISPALLQSAWTAATATCGNEAAYSCAVGALMALEGKRLLGYRHLTPSFRSTFTTLILRGLLGLRFKEDGVFFAPYVPENLPGEKTIGNLRYRDALLDIKITGTGKAISTFTIDGKPSGPFLDASLKGKHSISITLAGASADPGFVNLRENTPMAPLPPVVEWTAERQAKIHTGSLPANLPDNSLTETDREFLEEKSGECRLVYINGILQEEIFRDTYRLYNAPKLAIVQFTALVNSELSGFSSKPYLYLPSQQRTSIYASSIAKSGTKILEDKKLAAKFVESTRFRNRNIGFDFNAPRSGRYIVDVHYANGLGIVNTQRKTALRSLRVNSKEAGIFIFPQLSPATTRHGDNESWQEMTVWSNSLIITLEKGTNRIELRYYQPSPVYADPNSNVVLFDIIRLTPAD